MPYAKNGTARIWWVIGPIVLVLSAGFVINSTRTMAANATRIESLSDSIFRIDATLLRMDTKLDKALGLGD